MIDFVAQAMKDKKDGGGGVVPPISKKKDVTSTISLHQGGVEERGGPSSYSKESEGGEHVDRDLIAIVDYCRYVMGIYDFQLTKERLEKIRCTKEEVSVVHNYLGMQHQSDTWVVKSRGDNFMALAIH